MHTAEYLQNSQAATLVMHNVGSKVQKRLLIPQQVINLKANAIR